MRSNCILDSVTNLLVRHMVFVGNVQKSPIASHLKGLDSSLKICCQVPALTCIKKVDKMSIRSDVFLSLHMIVSLEKAAVIYTKVIQGY